MKRAETYSCSLCNKLYTYLYHHIVVLDKYIHSNLVYYKQNVDDEPLDSEHRRQINMDCSLLWLLYSGPKFTGDEIKKTMNSIGLYNSKWAVNISSSPFVITAFMKTLQSNNKKKKKRYFTQLMSIL